MHHLSNIIPLWLNPLNDNLLWFYHVGTWLYLYFACEVYYLAIVWSLRKILNLVLKKFMEGMSFLVIFFAKTVSCIYDLHLGSHLLLVVF